MKQVLYHNPRCSKSREAHRLLSEAGIEVEIIEYLKTPLSVADLRGLARNLGIKPRAMLRTKEDVFKELDIDLEDDAAVLAAIAAHPILLERPIFVRGDKAVIGRPPERVKELL